MEKLDIIKCKKELRRIQNELKSIKNNSTYDNNRDIDIELDSYEIEDLINKLHTFICMVINFIPIVYISIFLNNPFISLPFFFMLSILIKNYIVLDEKIREEKTKLNNYQIYQIYSEIVSNLLIISNRLTKEELLNIEKYISVENLKEIDEKGLINYIEFLAGKQILEIESLIGFLNKLSEEDVIKLQSNLLSSGKELNNKDEVIKYLESLTEEEKSMYLSYKNVVNIK